MSKRYRNVLTIALGSLLLAACQDSVTAPSPAQRQTNLLDTDPVWVTGQLMTKDPVVSQWIGPEGGTLVLSGFGVDGEEGQHTLTVPAGALVHTLLFTMELSSQTQVEVELSAYKVGASGKMIEVGRNGFRKPVTLSMSWAGATNVTDPEALNIVWVVDGNAKEKVRKVGHDGHRKSVSGELSHFSRYKMAAN